MAFNYPPGLSSSSDPRSPLNWHWAEDEEDEHHEFCGVNRVNRRPCDCDGED